jgi:hypothetical protein
VSIEERIIKVVEEPLGLWAVQRNKRELRAIALEVHKLEDRIKRLEEAGDAMLNAWLMPEDSMEYCDWIALSADAKAKWHKAKEAKP